MHIGEVDPGPYHATSAYTNGAVQPHIQPHRERKSTLTFFCLYKGVSDTTRDGGPTRKRKWIRENGMTSKLSMKL